MEDLYATLGVARDASADDIKKAYRKLARVHHPDANPGDSAAEERFKQISHAHDVLSDADKRREYDQLLRFGGRPPNGGASGGGGAGFGEMGDFADLFSSIFRGGRGGGGRGRPDPDRRGADVEAEVRVSFEQAMAGAKVPLSIETPSACATCGGSGATPGTSPRLCPECNGRGVRGRDGGAFAFSEPCPRCRGNGTVIDDPCAACGGSGATAGRTQITVTIPAGVRDGTRVRVKGKGGPGRSGGPAGDLYVITRVTPSRLYERNGDDLVLNVPVTFAEAALGAQVEVPTLEGRIKLTVPPGSAEGRALRVPGKGAPHLKGGGRGDLIARLRIQVPRDLSDEQRETLERLAGLDRRDPRETLFS